MQNEDEHGVVLKVINQLSDRVTELQNAVENIPHPILSTEEHTWVKMAIMRGAPGLAAAQGSLYVRTDGSSSSTRLYVNTNGTTGWTNVTTAT